MASSSRPRTALVLSGGGARGAYEAGVLAHLFERVYARLGPDFEFDVVSGTSVGAIHAAFTAASTHMEAVPRARQLAETWSAMRIGDVLRLSTRNVLAAPLRALGLMKLSRADGGASGGALGGIVDMAPLERLVADRVPWSELRRNLDVRRGGATTPTPGPSRRRSPPATCEPRRRSPSCFPPSASGTATTWMAGCA
jgi:NTE family protein